MKALNKILQTVDVIKIIGNTNISICDINFDSRKVDANQLFVALKGAQADGHNYINKAIDLGAVAILCEVLPKEIKSDISYILVNDTHYALGLIASNFYDNPSKKLKLVGVTGTNGKTTIATLLYSLFKKLGYKSGLISTVNNIIDTEIVPSTHTTPDAIKLNELLSRMVDVGCDYCFMEVSSHSIVQNRIAGLNFNVGIFTNITQDHLDYHKTFKEYINAKKMFFDNLPNSAFALTNIDDRNGEFMLQNCKAKKYSFAIHSFADFKCKVLESHFEGMLLDVNGIDVWTKLIGDFNASNLLAVYATTILLNQKTEEVLQNISSLNSVKGRFEYIRSDKGITAIVDYAHTPDALKNVLTTINQIRSGNEQVITVVGAGGDRDKTKRPLMAKIVSELSSKVILTSDNPRSENPEDIINDMKKGIEPIFIKNTISITDRKEAIKTAYMFADKGDIILIAGKGHENYQEIKGVRNHFDDKEIVEQLFKNILNC
ncbi:MAG: UDP-N-acetylmuramoyl-L-alanyl-D-glutamate--2,6-diaminopimelate ligase [Bacteroidales bacterium]|nr:UDP-N-acetylmuramoyl-L-alanyl-D-glutamate--2,6-diaminopimelate ligase [Bacteroidales bacterium]